MDLPAGAKVVVVSKGDPQLLELNGRCAAHFPQTEDGEYTGNPADSDEAISQLERVRARGTEYLIFPKTAHWWLEHYRGFHDHLNSHGHLVRRSDECIIYDLRSEGGRIDVERLDSNLPSTQEQSRDRASQETMAGNQQDRRKLLATLLSERPKLHFWGDEWQDGGLNDAVLRELFEITSSVSDRDGGVVLETGAGLSTLVLLAARPKKLITIAPDEALRQRIGVQIERFITETQEHSYYVDHSENVLPELATASAPYLDLALIDGGHGMPTVFVDFCYINAILKQGGYVAIDDLHLHSVRQLFLLLKDQPGFEVAADFGKTAFFKKTQDERFLPNWGGHPFVIRNSPSSA